MRIQSSGSVIAKLRAVRSRNAPALGKQALLAFVNPALRGLLPRYVTERRLERLLRRHGIVHLDLGGWAAIEDYLTIHMSLVEPYGLPRFRCVTYRQRFRGDDRPCEIEMDRLNAAALTLSFDALTGLPIADGAMAGINMSRFLEHFTLEEGVTIVRECRRVLRPGGVLRISCPDLRRYAAAYIARDRAFFATVSGPAFCRYPDLETFGDRFISKAYDNEGGHKWFYDAESLSLLLRKAGFTAIEERRVGESRLPHIESIEPPYRARETFYIEAIR